MPGPLFKYDTCLDRTKIRLLTFTSEAADAARLTFDLTTHHFDPAENVPKFIALSYTWGPKDPIQTIAVNNCRFEVGPALERALAHLRDKIKSSPIWIDAICINQKDNTEKSSQVDMMRTIYESAETTIVWLGESADESDSAMAYLDRVGEQAVKARLLDLDTADVKAWSVAGDDPEKEGIKADVRSLFPGMGRGSDGQVAPLEAILTLSEREWFSRVWVVQELTIAQCFEFMCGDKSVPGYHFIAGFEVYLLWLGDLMKPLIGMSSFYSLPFWVIQLWWRTGWSFMRTMLRRTFWAEDRTIIMKPDQRALDMGILSTQRTIKRTALPSPRAMTTLGTRRNFNTILNMTFMEHLSRAFVLTSDISLQASDPRDRIYALIKLARDQHILLLWPDYSKSYQQVYAHTAKSLIMGGNLDVLSFCRSTRELKPKEISPCQYCTDSTDSTESTCFHLRSRTRMSDRDSTLPSWVPDWTKVITPPWGESIADDLFKVPDRDNFIARYPLTQEPNSDDLVLEVHLIGMVNLTGTCWHSTSIKNLDWAAILAIHKQLDAFLNKFGKSEEQGKTVPNPRYTEKQREEGIWKIPIGDQEINDLGLRQRATAKSCEGHRDLISFLEGRTRRWYSRYLPRLPNLSSYVESMLHMQDSRPFISYNGHVGLCPDSTQKNDFIVFPVGAHVPYVIRKAEGVKDERWILIGEAYVYGMMDGEIWTEAPKVEIDGEMVAQAPKAYHLRMI
jgi:hypothetical protein